MEAPGTAPGSEWFIATAVYFHSRRTGISNIGCNSGEGQTPFDGQIRDKSGFHGELAERAGAWRCLPTGGRKSFQTPDISPSPFGGGRLLSCRQRDEHEPEPKPILDDLVWSVAVMFLFRAGRP